jgi:hypothetical protein
MPMKRIQKWIERIPRHIQKILEPEISGRKNYKEGRQDFDTRQGLWKGARCKGQLSKRVDMGTDLDTADNEAWEELPFCPPEGWEEFMSDNEDQKEESDDNCPVMIVRRRRPQHQTPEEKAAWDEETRVLRNAKAKIARLKKKLTRAAKLSISSLPTISSNSLALPLTLPPSTTSPAPPLASPPSTASPTPPLASPPSTTSSAPSLASPPSIISPALPTAISNRFKASDLYERFTTSSKYNNRP